jgi:uncharacterized membrane protein
MVINKNDQIQKLSSFSDKFADKVTKVAGSPFFFAINVLWFTTWITVNVGNFGEHLIFDKYPFGLLTMVVSLEAIILSVFVLISQNRQARRAEIRAELDYITDLQADVEITTILNVLERLAAKQNIKIDDLLAELVVDQAKIIKEHPIKKKDLELSSDN